MNTTFDTVPFENYTSSQTITLNSLSYVNVVETTYFFAITNININFFVSPSYNFVASTNISDSYIAQYDQNGATGAYLVISSSDHSQFLYTTLYNNEHPVDSLQIGPGSNVNGQGSMFYTDVLDPNSIHYHASGAGYLTGVTSFSLQGVGNFLSDVVPYTPTPTPTPTPGPTPTPTPTPSPTPTPTPTPSPVSVPEPATATLLLSAVAGLAALRRRRVS
jgi:hypothetical protein